uniref:Uncharacterized protein n=1 Tax=Cucumis melo TaxID=3656 RepID=A0A9I9ELU5_CUCME
MKLIPQDSLSSANTTRILVSVDSFFYNRFLLLQNRLTPLHFYLSIPVEELRPRSHQLSTSLTFMFICQLCLLNYCNFRFIWRLICQVAALGEGVSLEAKLLSRMIEVIRLKARRLCR